MKLLLFGYALGILTSWAVYCWSGERAQKKREKKLVSLELMRREGM